MATRAQLDADLMRRIKALAVLRAVDMITAMHALAVLTADNERESRLTRVRNAYAQELIQIERMKKDQVFA